MTNKLLLRLLLHIVLLIFFTTVSVVLFYYEIGFGFILAVIATLLCSFLVLRIFFSTMTKVGFMFNSIENDDFTFRFTSGVKSNINERYINESLNRIKDLVLAARAEARNKEKYFELILDEIGTGILVCNDQGVVFNVNESCLKNFGISYLTHLRQLDGVHSVIAQVLFEIKGGQTTSVKYYDEASLVTLSLTCAKINTYNQVAKVITITNIAQDIDNSEMESWQRLSRVLTHEIMNSLAPITSLSETLLSVDDSTTREKGLVVINETAKRLTAFVDNYRQLTKVPKPTLCLVDMGEIISSALALFDQKIAVEYKTSALFVEVDKALMSQVVINLIKNAVEAPQATTVWIVVSRAESGEFLVDICNNGETITDDMRENIFVPFYTTKSQGSGIGLSLCRQIVRLHNGKLSLITKPNTIFRITL